MNFGCDKAEDVPQRTRVLATQVAVGGLVMLLSAQAHAGEWQIVRLNDTEPLAAPSLQFSRDGSYSGMTGCNSFQGTVRLEGGELLIDGPVAATRMACPGNGLDDQDDAIIAVFSGNIAVEFDPLLDLLRLTKDGIVLDLARVPATDPSLSDLPESHAGLGRPDGDPPYLTPFGLPDDMPIHAEADTASGVVGSAFLGQVLTNDGCDEDWCRVASLDGTTGGWGERQYLEASDPVLRAGQGVFDAVAQVPCALGIGAPMTTCAMGVAHDDNGNATAVITKPDGNERALFFTDGAFVSSDTSEAGGGFEVSVSRESDLNLIRVDDERYKIPDSVIFGG